MASELERHRFSMNSVQDLLWEGEINVQIYLHDSILISKQHGSSQNSDYHVSDKPYLNLRLPREAYLPMYLMQILNQLQLYLVSDDIERMSSRCWFCFKNKILPWFLPIGVMFDMTMASMIISRNSKNYTRFIDDIINVWPITLHYMNSNTTYKKIPSGVIPLIDGERQVESYWMHRWKQACFIMTGSSKLMMSLSRNDAVAFWNSIKSRNSIQFQKISKNIIPSTILGFRMVPVKFHKVNYINNEFMDPIQPVITFNGSSDSFDKLEDITLRDSITKEFPDLFDENGNFNAVLLAQGIILQLDESIYTLYTSLLSIDGFLHIIIAYS